MSRLLSTFLIPTTTTSFQNDLDYKFPLPSLPNDIISHMIHIQYCFQLCNPTL